MNKEELLKGLSEEQIIKVNNCHSCDEIFELAKNERVELTPEQLAAVSGGACNRNVQFCPMCHGTDFGLAPNRTGFDVGKTLYYCRNCKECFFYEDDD